MKSHYVSGKCVFYVGLLNNLPYYILCSLKHSPQYQERKKEKEMICNEIRNIMNRNILGLRPIMVLNPKVLFPTIYGSESGRIPSTLVLNLVLKETYRNCYHRVILELSY